MAAKPDKRKQSLYFPQEMLEELNAEATRQERSLSWLLQHAWKLASKRIKSYPPAMDAEATETDGD